MTVAASIASRLAVSFAALWILSGPAYAKNTACAPTETCIDKDALWAALESKDRSEFQHAFKTLRKSDQSKLYSEIRNLNFDDTDEDRARALMVAQIISETRRKISPTQQSFDYWAYWYATKYPESTERLIPAYLLFDLQEKVAGKISGADKEKQRFKRQIQKFENNEQEKLYGKTPEYWIKYYEKRLAEYEAFPQLFDTTTAAFVQEEEAALTAYFRVFDVIQQQTDNSRFSSFRLPFPAVLEAAIQTEDLWVDAFTQRLKCGPTDESHLIIAQIAELDSHNPTLKKCLKARLTHSDNMPLVMGTLSFISQFDALRLDRDLHEAVSEVDENHPFTSIRLARQIVLSAEPAPKVSGNGQFIWRGPRKEMLKALNANRTYCEAGPLGKFPYFKTLPKFHEPQTYAHLRRGEPVMTVKTPSGYLTGHDRGEFGGGLLYYTDKNSEPETLFEGNMIAIIESEHPGIYWGLSGLNHMVPGIGTILRIDARTDDVSVKTHKRMPVVTRNVKLLKDGDLFMDFRRRKTSSVQGRDKDISQPPDPRFNPPVVLTRAGEIVSACGD